MWKIVAETIKILSIEIERARFPKSVRLNMEQALDIFKYINEDNVLKQEANIRSGLVLLQTAINNISTNRIHSSLYFFCNPRKDNIDVYNDCCSKIAAMYSKLGQQSIADNWYEKMIEIDDDDDNWCMKDDIIISYID